MKTLMRDSTVVIPGVRKSGHKFWFLHQAHSRGFEVSETVADRKPIFARVDHGRWIADCTLDYAGQKCIGAECVTSDDKTFMCLSCGNDEVGGQLLAVRFPQKKKREDLEEVLNERPEANRNWSSGETVEKLEKENRRHKVKVPKDEKEKKDKGDK